MASFLGIAALAVCRRGSRPDDSSAHDEALSLADAPALATSTVRTLLTRPTRALVRQAVSDHSLTPDETKLLAVFWLTLVDGQDTGNVPRPWVSTDLLSVVAGMAAEYPDFFLVPGDSSEVGVVRRRPPLATVAIPVEPAAGCADPCVPTLRGQFLEAVGADALPPVAAQRVRAVASIPAALSEWTAITNAESFTSSSWFLADVTAQSEAGSIVDAVGSALLSPGTRGVPRPLAARAVAAVAAISAATTLASRLSRQVGEYQSCRSWQADQCPVDSAADGAPEASSPDLASLGDDSGLAARVAPGPSPP